MTPEKIAFWTLIVFLQSLPFARGDGIEPRTLQQVSMISLIANPQPYQGKYIQTHGYCKYEDGYAILYLSEETAKHSVFEDAIWLYLGKKIKNPETFADKWITIQGSFNPSDRGRWQAFSSSLEQVDTIQLK